jgi:hypothetical protein
MTTLGGDVVGQRHDVGDLRARPAVRHARHARAESRRGVATSCPPRLAYVDRSAIV